MFVDLYRGVCLPQITPDANGQLRVPLAMEAHGYGCLLAVGEDQLAWGSALSTLINAQRDALSVGGLLSSFSASWTRMVQRRVCVHASDDGAEVALTPRRTAKDVPFGKCVRMHARLLPTPSAQSTPPPTAVRIPASDEGGFAFRSEGTEIEPFNDGDGFGLDAQFPWESDEAWTGTRAHEATLHVPSFFMDVAPVSCERFSQFLSATNYKPEDSRGFLPSWPDWRAASYPSGHENVPVTSVSLEEARLFCSWAGGRLPTLVEWQYAAQAGDPTRVYPWGVEDDTSLRPPPTTGREAGSPYSSDAEHAMRGANPWGLRDLIGNVWQWTDSEFSDGHTRFALLRGGSFYQPVASSDFQNWYFGAIQTYLNPDYRPGQSAAMLTRHAKFFRFAGANGAAYERSATVGFRCAYNRAVSAISEQEVSNVAPGAIQLVVLLCVLLTANHARKRGWGNAAMAKLAAARAARGSGGGKSSSRGSRELDEDDDL